MQRSAWRTSISLIWTPTSDVNIGKRRRWTDQRREGKRVWDGTDIHGVFLSCEIGVLAHKTVVLLSLILSFAFCFRRHSFVTSHMFGCNSTAMFVDVHVWLANTTGHWARCLGPAAQTGKHNWMIQDTLSPTTESSRKLELALFIVVL